jgi:hypothetical protein
MATEDTLQALVTLVPVASVILSVGIAYGVLRVKSATTATRLNELEAEALRLDTAMQVRVEKLTSELSHHKADTTDRLARIETKLDILLSQR